MTTRDIGKQSEYENIEIGTETKKLPIYFSKEKYVVYFGYEHSA